MFEPANDRYLAYNAARADQRFIPASTFKIPNALIGLEVGSIADEKEVFRWDGKPVVRDLWELTSQTLATGMAAASCGCSRRSRAALGRERMDEWIESELEYGNRDIRGGIELFWLCGVGRWRISAKEQVDFPSRARGRGRPR